MTKDMESSPGDSIFEMFHLPKTCVANKDGVLVRIEPGVVIKLDLSEPVTCGTRGERMVVL